MLASFIDVIIADWFDFEKVKNWLVIRLVVIYKSSLDGGGGTENQLLYKLIPENLPGTSCNMSQYLRVSNNQAVMCNMK